MEEVNLQHEALVSRLENISSLIATGETTKAQEEISLIVQRLNEQIKSDKLFEDAIRKTSETVNKDVERMFLQLQANLYARKHKSSDKRTATEILCSRAEANGEQLDPKKVFFDTHKRAWRLKGEKGDYVADKEAILKYKEEHKLKVNI